MPLPPAIDLTDDAPPIQVLYEDRDCLALDKPEGWETRLVEDGPAPSDNLQAALQDAVLRGRTWVRENDIRFLRLVGYLDADATGVQLVAKSMRAAQAFTRQFEQRPARVEFLTVVGGKPNRRRWASCLKIRPDPAQPGRMLTHTTQGQYAEASYEVVAHGDGMALLLVRPKTHRPHQIRAQLSALGLPILGDRLYGPSWEGRRPLRSARQGEAGVAAVPSPGLALRAMRLVYTCPLTARPIEILAPMSEFLERFGFSMEADSESMEPGHDEAEPT